MPPKKATPTASVASGRVTRSTRQTRAAAAAVASNSMSSTSASEASRASSGSSTPNTSFSLSNLNIDDDDKDDKKQAKENSDDEDDFLPSTVVTPSAVALGKRRKIEDPSSNQLIADPRSLKRTRSSGSMDLSRRLKIESDDDDDSDLLKSEDLSEIADSPPPSKSTVSKRPTRSKAAAVKLEASTSKSVPSSSSSSSTHIRTKPSRIASVKAAAAVSAQIKDDSDNINEESDDDDDDDDDDASSSDSSEGSVARPISRARDRTRGTMTWAEKVNKRLLEFHPELATVWDDLEKVGIQAPEAAEQPEGLKLKLLPFQREGLGWMRKQEKSMFKGGILADEMGMGKTIQMISLLLSESGKPNLIVAPTVAILQWVSEITNHAPSLKALVFHGPNRTESMKELLSHDVVVTTYSIIESAFRKQKYGFRRGNTTVKEYSLLHRIKWYRIILDEAHNIKERSCNTARSAFALEADRKWCLSGTPMQNRVGELYSLIRFMQADPYGYYFCKKCSCKSLHWKYSNMKDCDDCGHRPMDHVCWWNNEILKPIQTFAAEGSGEEAFAKLRKLLDRIMLRRTKVERADDLGLPPRKMIVSRYLFNEEEEDLYESLFSDTKRKFSTYVEQGTVLNNYANIFELLTKMRQMVDHPDLVLKKVKPGDVGLPETLVCCICQEEAEDPIVSKCHHLFCREDAEQYITSSAVEAPECPVCHIPLSIDLQQPTYMKEEPDYEAEVKHRNFARTSIVNRINMDTWRSSTKIEALVEQLYNLQRQDRSTKSICFSQYVTFLDLIKWRLEKAGFKCVKLDGHMTPAQRDASIRKFSDDPTVTVFLISLKAGGVALNLTAASRVFICDPWWNPAAELQAMDRIHRIGQYRPILITRLIIENSIESRILQLQEKKQAMVDSTIGKDPAALARLTPEDLRFLFVN
ncbi:SNF2 family N-terminal domain-domain-containing protein [Lobosporangium transversale]|uniref:SNF2 family N-terminal domain-domain-containing protein n=1 Tax=Lobosporangium transversale TaxID=64571 RepID=A0A1Y2GRG8_9FUNG|nr:SNF2 family N-terminal domain-domain-containing protein [Lobosporangium transversale]ORZ20124.1 SNF2 family N-terminal domain-domain-containing protein [Lobosporangium transversale]|eukprot:XP_021882664.1 SNF2 family N-terminal domain-domain-containing protein [Lobosporangium transversale]